MKTVLDFKDARQAEKPRKTSTGMAPFPYRSFTDLRFVVEAMALFEKLDYENWRSLLGEDSQLSLEPQELNGRADGAGVGEDLGCGSLLRDLAVGAGEIPDGRSIVLCRPAMLRSPLGLHPTMEIGLCHLEATASIDRRGLKTMASDVMAVLETVIGTRSECQLRFHMRASGGRIEIIAEDLCLAAIEQRGLGPQGEAEINTRSATLGIISTRNVLGLVG